MKKFLYWFISLTWGALLSIPGLLVALFIVVFLKGKVHKNGYSFIVEFGGNWGGLNLGVVSFCGGYTTTCKDLKWFESTRRHEAGHSIQNLMLGPLTLFIVTIPSAIRYWYRVLTPNKQHSDYYAIWFERTANTLGERYINKVEI